MELGRSAWIRRERLERIATAERDRRAGRTALAIAALGEAVEWPARAVLALALLPDDEGAQARRVLEDGLDQWALESGLAPIADEAVRSDQASAPIVASAASAARPAGESPPAAIESGAEPGDAFQIELDRPIEPGELERAFAEAEAQVDEMHDVNDVAAGVLFDAGFDDLDVTEDDLDPLELSARELMASAAARPMDAAIAPEKTSGLAGMTRGAGSEEVPGTSQAFVLATLERWLQNLERSRAERMR